MAGTFNLKIATPQREVFNAQVESVSVPGMQAPFGVLRNHAPLISALDPGVVDIHDAQGKDIRFAIGGGFFQVSDNMAIILADSAESPGDIDVTRAEEALRRARARMAGQIEPPADVQFERAQAALHRAITRLRVAGQPHF